MSRFSVIIVDDHDVFRAGLKLFLEMTELVEVIGEAVNGADFLEQIEKSRPDLVFMDIRMPVMDGIEATEKALQKYPDLKIIALTAFGESENFDRMIYAGVEGFLLKNAGFNDFKHAIEKVMKGGNYFSDELLVNFTREVLTKRIKVKIETPDFSKRELEVLALICQGYTNQQIGDKLCISFRTVERYKTNLINKTKTSNTVNLILYTLKNKLVEV
ncbi:MAG: response regulator transcription factor [Bacteroidota bacterium]